jgi:hypothetical protein
MADAGRRRGGGGFVMRGFVVRNAFYEAGLRHFVGFVSVIRGVGAAHLRRQETLYVSD